MSQPTATQAPFQPEETFKAYNKEQGKAYAQIRRDYHPNLYQTIITHHTTTGGQLNTLLDVGCGPGTAARSLSSHFPTVIGLDPSDGMISTARSLGGTTSTGTPIHFDVSTAEELGSNLSPPIADASIDLVTASNAAHWFDLSGFWPAAARVLKPGGTVALWTSGEICVHPDMVGAAGVQAAFDKLREVLTPYTTPGNLLARGSYKELPLPWTLERPVGEFDEGTFWRKDYGPDEEFHVGQMETGMEGFEKLMGTGSAVTRWRQDHPEDVGTERDVLRVVRREIEKVLQEAGVEKDKERLKGYTRGALLMVKKKA